MNLEKDLKENLWRINKEEIEKMNKYKVDFFIRYIVEAKDKDEAKQIAENLFRSKLQEILANMHSKIFNLFGMRD